MKQYVDLHMHSIYSDGEQTPSELVDIAKQNNISVISLTDHDCVDGIWAAEQAGKKAGITVIPGIELSCFDKKDTHVLGYNIDCNDKSLNDTLNALQKSRIERMEKIIQKLQQGGFEISVQDAKRHCSGQVMGRPHIAAALIEKGYGSDTRDIFHKFIGSDCKYYVPYKKLTVQEGIDLIHGAGGIAVIAHPKLLRYNSMDFTSLIRTYAAMGMDGIEVYYPCHYNEHIKLFYGLAKELNLYVTCGGDYHNEHDPKKNIMGYEMDLPGVKETIEFLTGGKMV